LLEKGALFSAVLSDRARGNEHKLKHREVHLGTKNFFTMRVAEYWHRLPRKVVTPCLEILKTQMDTILGSLL